MILKRILLSTILLAICLTSVQAQYIREVDLSGRTYFKNEESSKLAVGLSNGEGIAISSVQETLTSGDVDILINHFSTGGLMLSSLMWGEPGESEIANAAIKGTGNDIIVVGQDNNYTDGLIAAFDYTTNTVSWAISVGDPNTTEELNAVAEIGNTGNYIATGYLLRNGRKEIYAVCFDGMGNIIWTSHNFDGVNFPNPYVNLEPTNIIDDPNANYMLITGTATEFSGQRWVFAARMLKASGQITLFRTYQISISTNQDMCVAGDICLLGGTPLLTFTTYEGNSVYDPSRITYLRLDATLMPNFMRNYRATISGINDYNYGLNIYLEGSQVVIGYKFGQHPLDVAPGLLMIDPISGTVFNATGYEHFSNQVGGGWIRGLSNHFYYRTGWTGTGFEFIQTDLSGNVFNNCQLAPVISTTAGSVNQSQFDLGSVTHGTSQTSLLLSNMVNGTNINPTCGLSGGWTMSFKKESTSVEEGSEHQAVYPSLLSSNDVLTINSSKINSQEVQVVISNALGQIIYQSCVDVSVDNSLQLPSNLFEKGINFVSLQGNNGAQILKARVLKQD